MAALLAHIHIFVPRMQTMAHICTKVDNTTAQGWANKGSVIWDMAVGPILRDLALITHLKQIDASIGRMKVDNNKMDDATSRPTHVPYRIFFHHFTLTFPQKNPWRLMSLTSESRQQKTSMLHIKRCHNNFMPLSTKRAPLPGANVTSSTV